MSSLSTTTRSPFAAPVAVMPSVVQAAGEVIVPANGSETTGCPTEGQPAGGFGSGGLSFCSEQVTPLTITRSPLWVSQPPTTLIDGAEMLPPVPMTSNAAWPVVPELQ